MLGTNDNREVHLARYCVHGRRVRRPCWAMVVKRRSMTRSPAARGMTISAGIVFTGDVYVARDWPRSYSNLRDRCAPLCGADDLTHYIYGRRIRRP
jgi:hypothetical protein